MNLISIPVQCFIFAFLIQVAEGGYDQKVNETMNVVATKTTEIGQKTWGIMRGVMALASQKVEEYSKEGINWKGDDWPWKERENAGSNQESGQLSGYQNTSEDNAIRHNNSTSSWDDWDNNERKEEHGKEKRNKEGWAGWDDDKDDDSYNTTSQGTKSGSGWFEGGFH